MSVRSVSLTPEQDAFLDEVLSSGVYRDVSEALGDALRALQQRRAIEDVRLRGCVDAGLADLDRGDFEEIEDSALEQWMDRVGDAARA